MVCDVVASPARPESRVRALRDAPARSHTSLGFNDKARLEGGAAQRKDVYFTSQGAGAAALARD